MHDKTRDIKRLSAAKLLNGRFVLKTGRNDQRSDQMNLSMLQTIRCFALAIATLSLIACSSSGTTDTDDSTSTGEFQFGTLNPVNLVEGDNAGVNIPVILDRSNGHNENISLSITGVTDSDSRLLSFNVSPSQLTNTQSVSSINVRLAIDDLPIMPQQEHWLSMQAMVWIPPAREYSLTYSLLTHPMFIC